MTRRFAIGWLLIALAAAPLLAGDVDAASAEAAPRGRWSKRHPWGRFSPGSRKRVLIKTDNFRDSKVVAKSSTETWTELVDVTPTGIELAVEANVKLDGQQLPVNAEKIRQGWYGEEPGVEVAVEDLGTKPVIIQGREYPCEVERVTTVKGDVTTETTTWYDEETPPFVLRRESVQRSASGQVLSKTEMRVEELEVMREVVSRMKPTAHLKITSTYRGGKQLTDAWTSTEIPGGIVAHRSENRDAEGNVVRRSTLELIDYAVK